MGESTPRRRNRRGKNERCCYPDCYERQQRGYDIPLCGSHISDIEQQLSDRPPRGMPRCMWPGCQQYTMWSPQTKLCSTHLAIVIRYGSDDMAARRILHTMTGSVENERPIPPMPKPASPQQGTVYYVKVGEHIKVGWTSDMEQRMRSYPPNSILLATEPGTRADEKRRHKTLAAHRSHGNEWYVPAPSVLHHLDMVKAKHGEPDPAAFAAKPVEIPQPRERHYIGGKNRGNWQRGEIRG